MPTLIEIVKPCQECEEQGIISCPSSSPHAKEISAGRYIAPCDDCDGEGYTTEVFVYEDFEGVYPDRKTEAALAAAREEWPDATCRVITYENS